MNRKLREEIEDAARAGPAELFARWREWKDTRPLSGDASAFIAEELIAGARYDDALEVLGTRRTVRARQLRGLALGKIGDVEGAIRVLQPLHARHLLDPESAGLLAGRYKQRGLERDSRSDLQTASLLYGDTFQATGNAWLGINVASLSLLLGDREKAERIARVIVERLSADPTRLDAWGLATLAEAHLLLGNVAEARTWYHRAVSANPNAVERLATMRRQARMNLRTLGLDPGAVDDILTVRKVAAFTGHLTDEPGRKPPRFPGEHERAVRLAIREHLRTRSVGFGFSSIARGSDILFLEELLECGGGAEVWLPFPYEDFARTSIGLESWRNRADAVLNDPRVRLTTLRDKVPEPDGLDAAYQACFEALSQGAVRFASRLDDEPLLLAVWDGREQDGVTARAVRDWAAQGYPVDIVSLPIESPPPDDHAVPPPGPDTRELRRQRQLRAAPSLDYPARHCACIGVSAYDPPPWCVLPNARRDAEEVARALEQFHGFTDPLLLLDGNVTEQSIRLLITHTLRNRAAPDDLVVVFFAGHGHTTRMSGQEHGFIVPVTARTAMEGEPPAEVRGDDPFRLVSINTLTDWSGWLECRHVLYVFDSCFSGMFQRMSGSDRMEPDVTRARIAITAGRADQPVYDGGAETPHSVFTDALLHALGNGVGTGEDFTATELYSFVRRRVAKRFPEQTPTLATLRNHEGGEILFRQPA